MNDSNEDQPVVSHGPTGVAVSDRFIEVLEIQVMRLRDIGGALQNQAILEIQHKLWMMTRHLRGDEDLSQDDMNL